MLRLSHPFQPNWLQFLIESSLHRKESKQTVQTDTMMMIHDNGRMNDMITKWKREKGV